MDEIEYHNIAVNLVLKKSYSLEPIEKGPTYYREPALPVFIAVCYKVWTTFGGDISNVSSKEHSNMLLEKDYPEMRFVILIQCFLSSIGVVLFYFTLCFYFNKIFSFITALLFALYLPTIFTDFSLMRESFQLFISICSSYFFVRFLVLNKNLDFFLFCIFSAVLALILKVAVIMPAIVFIIIFFKRKDFKEAVVKTLYNCLLILLLSSPWLIRSYRAYPHYQTILSWGTTLSFDKMKYMSVSRDMKSLNLVHPNTTTDSVLWSQDIIETFDKTVNGIYQKKTNLLKNIIKNQDQYYFIKKWFLARIKTSGRIFYRTIVIKGDTYLVKILNRISPFISVLLAIFALIGFVFRFYKYYYLSISSCLFIVIYTIITGSCSSRHILTTVPIFILMTTIGYNTLRYYYNKILYKHIKE